MEKTIGSRDLRKSAKMVNIGLENWISAGWVVAIMNGNSAPIKRMIKQAREASTLIDGSGGSQTRSVIFTDSKYIILSSISPRETLAREWKKMFWIKKRKNGGKAHHHIRAYDEPK